ncbi:hypothetical protein PC39_01555 [Salinisphaera sp. PC39]|uniref:MAPEG family protein n=1 Tax=Salinisphaera sp. PC39 TaxID=1304156 RepID=UPI00333F1AD4
MNASLASLVGFAALTLLPIVIFTAYRGVLVLTGQRRADDWTRGRAVADPGVIKRIGDAHANCLEMLPVFAAVILAAEVAGAGEITRALAPWFLLARVGQFVSHAIAVNHWMVFLVRFPLFLIQVVILFWWLWQLAGLI